VLYIPTQRSLLAIPGKPAARAQLTLPNPSSRRLRHMPKDY